MTSRGLLDVNVLIALLDRDHALHERATTWFAQHAGAGWASCPITQNGCVRVMSHPGYPNALPVSAVIARLTEATSTPHHEFWADEISLLDSRHFDAGKIHGPRQITDVYLVALATTRQGRFVTFDHSVAVVSIHGARPDNVLVL